MTDREKLIDIILCTPCVAVSSRTAAGHIADNLIANGIAMVVYGQMEEINPCDITVDRQCCSCGTPMGSQDHYCPNCGKKMIRKDDT